MKKQKRLGTFLSGMLAGAMLLSCGSAALAAAGGNVRFGSVGLKTISGKTVVEAGATITNANGCKIPAAIVYTDEAGGDNTYIHLRTVGEALELPVDWENGMVYLGGKSGGLSDITIGGEGSDHSNLPLNVPGAKAAHYTEVEPYWPADREITGVYSKDSHIVGLAAGGSLGPADNGEYLSLSVTNNTGKDMYLSVRSPYLFQTRFERFPSTLVPAGKTVIRTFQAGTYTGYLYPREIDYSVYFVEDSSLGKTVDVTINAVNFVK